MKDTGRVGGAGVVPKKIRRSNGNRNGWSFCLRFLFVLIFVAGGLRSLSIQGILGQTRRASSGPLLLTNSTGTL